MVVVRGSILKEDKVRVPFSLHPTWCIPARRVVDPDMAMQQMTVWPSAVGLSKISSIKGVLEVWDNGVKVNQDGKEYQLAPLKVLEHPALRHLWRFTGPGSSMGKAILLIKNVVYAVHKRVMGFPRKSEDVDHQQMSLAGAIEDLEQVLGVYTQRDQGPSATQRAQPSLYKLAETLITGNKEFCLSEYTPNQYEEKVLKGDHAIFTLCSGMWSQPPQAFEDEGQVADTV
eukprot:gene25448-11111_t